MDKKKNPTRGGAGAEGHGHKSTATAVQRERILAALRNGPKTSYDLRRMGCYQAPARVFELRNMGHVIHTAFVPVVDADGYRHAGVALYSLEVPTSD